jgi:hypothetical protein
MSTPEEIEPDADANRIDRALAGIEQCRQEIQMPLGKHDSGIAGLLAETKRCQVLTELEIDNVIAEIEARREGATKLVDESMSQQQPASVLGVDQNTISNDVKTRRQEKRPRGPWQLFAAGFAFGAVCFVAAVTLFRFLGYASSGLITFWLFIVPAATIILSRRFKFGEAQKA